MPRITLRAIAEKLGCTRSTVSYALRNHPAISAELREKVKTVASEMGWSPDAALQRQMSLVRSTISRNDLPNLGIVLNRSRGAFAKMPTMARHLEGVCQRAAELGFGLDIFRLQENPLTNKRLCDVMKSRGIRGVIFVDIDINLHDNYMELAREFASVSVGCVPESMPIHVVTVDYMALGRRMITELLKLGYRRPGVALPRGTERLIRWSFTGGLKSGIVMLPEEDQIPFCYCGTDHIHIPIEDFQRVQEWVDLNAPDVLVGIDTYMFRAAMSELPKHKKLPIFSLDWHPHEGADGGIDQSAFSVGVAGLEMLVSLLDRGECGLPKLQRTVLVRENWVMSPPGENSLPHVDDILEDARKLRMKTRPSKGASKER